MSKIYWYSYTLGVAVALYWLSNLILWYPWSRNPLLGMILMLTLNPVIWGSGEYACLRRFPGPDKWLGVWVVVLMMLGVSIVSDFLFFALYLHSNDVWHPTTFYGYGFVAVLPFLIRWAFRHRLAGAVKMVSKQDIWRLAGMNIGILFLFFAFVV